MNVTINGATRDVETPSSVVDLLVDLGRDPSRKGVAIAVNGEVVPRSQWDSHIVNENDRVELLEAVQGG